MVSLGVLAAALYASVGYPGIHPMANGGTPAGIPVKTDCHLRQFVWEAGQKLMPRRGQFKTLFDAMQLDACGVAGCVALFPLTESITRVLNQSCDAVDSTWVAIHLLTASWPCMRTRDGSLPTLPHLVSHPQVQTEHDRCVHATTYTAVRRCNLRRPGPWQ